MNLKYIERDPNFNNEEAIIQARAINSSELKQQVIENNIPLVNLLVQRWIKKGSTTPQEELRSMGFEGLVKAFNTYNVSRNVKFASYAGSCIWQEFTKAVAYQNYRCRSDFKTISLHKKVRNEKEQKQMVLEDLIADKSISSFDTIIMRNELLEEFMKVVKNDLTPNEKLVAIKFFLEGKGFSDIGREIGVTRQGVHQIHKRNIQKLQMALV